MNRFTAQYHVPLAAALRAGAAAVSLRNRGRTRWPGASCARWCPLQWCANCAKRWT